MTTTPPPMPKKPTGKLAFAMQTIINMEERIDALEAENADLKRKLAEASTTLCIGGQMISAIASSLEKTND